MGEGIRGGVGMLNLYDRDTVDTGRVGTSNTVLRTQQHNDRNLNNLEPS